MKRSSRLNVLHNAGVAFIAAVLMATAAAAQRPVLQPTASPTPTPSPTASPTPVAVQTLSDLQSYIRDRAAAPILRRGQVGIKIVSLKTGKTVFEQNADKYFMPASNMKNFTVAAALERLTPDHRFVTSLLAAQRPDADGVLKGDLRIYGRGDVSFSSSFQNGSRTAAVDTVVSRIIQAGIKRIEGSVIGDDSYFIGNAVPGSWEYDDLQWYYGAEVSALPVNDNAIGLTVKPGPAGYPCAVTIDPAGILYRVENKCVTSPAGSPRTLTIKKAIDRNELVISGDLPLGNAGFNGTVSVSRPAELFAFLVTQQLQAKGIEVKGTARAENDRSRTPAETVEIASIESPPLALIAAKTMKPSQNMYTEILLWTLGERERQTLTSPADRQKKESWELGVASVKRFLAEAGLEPDEVLQQDGSGLSRHDLITPNAVIKLYTYMATKSRYSTQWRDSLTIGGVDGTLANRFKGTRAAANMRGKTGTIDQVSALSGYVTTAAGEPLVVSFIVNGVPVTRDRTSMIDDIVVRLADFTGKID